MSLPQIAACSRARWTALLGGDARLHAALSFESLLDEGVFIVGPVLVTTLATTIAPAAGLLAALALVSVGSAGFVAQRRTEPPLLPRGEVPRGRHAIRHRGLMVIVGVFLAIGVLFGLIEVGIVALTREQDHPAMAGTILALWTTGSLLSGIAYGAITWRTPPARRFQIGAAAMAAGCVLIAAASASLVAVSVALVVAGFTNAPTLITGNTLIPSLVPTRAVTEAYTWLQISVFAGIAVGSPLGGTLIDHAGAATSLWASVAAGAVAAVIAITGNGALQPRTPADSEPA